MTARCDFCSAPDPEWIYPSNNFALPVPGPQDWGSSGAWAACEVCSTLIEAGKYRRLTRRALTRTGQLQALPRDMQQAVLASADQLHARFQRERKGPRRAFG